MRFAFDDNEEFDLDRDFPLGDGTAETSGQVVCPYCGSVNDVALDPGGGSSQQYVEDCQVCCRPNVLEIYRDPETEDITISAELE